MKKALSFTLILIFSLSFAACGNEDSNKSDNNGMTIKITVGTVGFMVKFYDNETAQALADMLPITINMSELNGNEKYYYLPNNLPTAAINPGTVQTGDIMLYGSNCLVLFYKTFSTSYSYTKIGRIENTAGLMAALDKGNVNVTFSIEIK